MNKAGGEYRGIGRWMESRNSPITYFRRRRGRTYDRRSRAHLFVADHFLLMYRRPRRFRMRNEMASRNLSSVIYDAPCAEPVCRSLPTNTHRSRRTPSLFLAPPRHHPPKSLLLLLRLSDFSFFLFLLVFSLPLFWRLIVLQKFSDQSSHVI